MQEILIQTKADGRIGVMAVLGELPKGKSIVVIEDGVGVLKADQRKAAKPKHPKRRSGD